MTKKKESNELPKRRSGQPRAAAAGSKEAPAKKAPAKKAPAKAATKAPPAQNASKRAPAKAATGKRAAGAAEEPAGKRVKQPEGARSKEPTKESLPPIPPIETQAGRIYVCGMGDSGQLGLGEPRYDDSPTDHAEVGIPRFSPLPDLPTASVKQIAAGGMHSVAVSMEGQVYTTGVNDEAALGRKTDTKIWQKVIPRPPRQEGEDGPEEEGSPEREPFPPGEFGPGGRLPDNYTWGRVDVPDMFGKIEKVSAGDSHTVALTSLGALYAWGTFRGDSGPWAFLPGVKFALQPTLVYEPKSYKEQIVEISSGADHVLALTRDSKVLSWGYGKPGQLGRIPTKQMRHNREEDMLEFGPISFRGIAGVGAGFKPASIATGSFSSFITSTTGQVVACGVNNYGQLGHLAEGQAMDSHSVHWPCLVEGLQGKTVKAVSSAATHTIALDTTGRVTTFGKQTYGRLGRRDADVESGEPMEAGPVDNLDDVPVTGVVAGPDTSSILAEGGQVYMTGMGGTRQLARNSEADAAVPFQVNLGAMQGSPPVTRVSQVAFGGQHTMLLVN